MDIGYYKKYEPIFGSWYITDLIGEGTFGKVFKIEKTDFGETYQSALKVITIPQNNSEVRSMTSSGMDENSVTSYFESVVVNVANEFKLMSAMKGHSNIVSYEDHQVFKHENGIGWDILIRMELLTPVDEHFKNKGFDKQDLIKLGIDMCRALEVCQNKSIIHRDIKPENIFISDNGDYKLGDFGVAKKFEHTVGVTARKGTYSYMAPEVYKGKSFGNTADIYSVGIVLYRYFNNNRTPFLSEGILTPDDIEEALIKRISGEELPAPKNSDERLNSIILKACAYRPEDRYTSPREMREALEAYLKNEPCGMPFPPNDNGGGTIIDNPVEEGIGTQIENGTIINPTPPVDKPEKDPSGGKGGEKKAAVIVAAVLLLIALIAGTVFLVKKSGKTPKHTETTTVANDLSESDDPVEDKIVGILLNDPYFVSDYLYTSDGSEHYCTFIDMDFDGINELIINEHNEADGYNYVEILKFDLENQKYSHLYVNGYADFNINNLEINLFSDDTNGNKPYFVVEKLSVFSNELFLEYGMEDLENYSSETFELQKLFYAPGQNTSSDIYTTSLLCVDLFAFNENDDYTYIADDGTEFTVKRSNAVDFMKEQKNKFLNELSKTDKNLNLKYQVFNGQEFSDLSKEDKEKVLRASYRAFDYDGKPKATGSGAQTARTVTAESTGVPESTTQTMFVKTAGSDLNMRKAADLTADVVLKIPNGYPVYVLDTEGDWTYINYDYQNGWVKTEFLINPDDTDESETNAIPNNFLTNHPSKATAATAKLTTPQKLTTTKEATAKKIAYNRGKVVDGEYVNDWANIRMPIQGYDICETNPNESINNVEVGVGLARGLNTCIISFVSGYKYKNMTESDFLAGEVSGFKEECSNITFFEESYGTTEIAGQNYSNCLLGMKNKKGEILYELLCVRKIDSRYCYIAITAETKEEIQQMADMIKPY